MRFLLGSAARRFPGSDDPARGGSRAQWLLSRRAVLEVWGDAGTEVRAVLTSPELVAFLDTVLREPGGAAMAGSTPAAVMAADQSGRLS